MTSFQIQPLDASFGATITGIKLTSLDDHGFDELYQAWLEYALLIFPGQHMTGDEQIGFAKRFGELEFDLAPISNVKKDGTVAIEDDSEALTQLLKGNMGWHCDSTYMPVQAKGAVFTAHVVPASGGETGWADLGAGYETLDDEMKARIAGLSAYHSLYHSQKMAGFTPAQGESFKGYGFFDQDPPLRELIKTHPETGRKSLQIGRHAYGIPGLEEAESAQLLDELLSITCQAPRIYHHQWTKGDAVVWDNRCLMHQGCPWDMSQPRVMYHARIAGDPVSELAESA